jgi:hypothetical protein
MDICFRPSCCAVLIVITFEATENAGVHYPKRRTIEKQIYVNLKKELEILFRTWNIPSTNLGNDDGYSEVHCAFLQSLHASVGIVL